LKKSTLTITNQVSTMLPPFKVFIIYSRADTMYRDKLSKSLSLLQNQQLIQLWHDGMIKPGSNWDAEIERNIDNSDLLLMLISDDFYHSNYIQSKESILAFERYDRGECKIIPLIIRYCDWKNDPRIKNLQVLPDNGQPIDDWSPIDKAYENIVQRIREVIDGVLEESIKGVEFYQSDLIMALASKVVSKFKYEYFNKHHKAFYSDASDERLFGFGNYAYANNPIEDTIAKYILEGRFTEEFIRQIGYRQHEMNHEGLYSNAEIYDPEYLLKKWKEASEKKDVAISFSNKFLSIFLTFLELKSMEELREIVEREKKYYVGFYLSFLSFIIRNFMLTISGYTDYKGKRRATLRGFHVREDAVDVEEYTGDTEIVNGWLYVYLIGKKYGKRINLIGAVNQSVSLSLRMPYIKASLQAISTSGRLFCSESLLCLKPYEVIAKNLSREDDLYGPVKTSNEVISEKYLSIISFYLVVHRNTFAFTNDQITDIEGLVARGNEIRDFTGLSATYRIWNYHDKYDKIIQSKFQINKDGTAYLYPYFSDSFYKRVAESERVEVNDIKEKLQRQPALINISRIHSGVRKLIVLTFGKPGLSIINGAMFDLPTDRNQVLNGEFITLGDDIKIRSNSVVMRRERTAGDFVPEEFGLQDVEEKIKNDNSLELFWEKLQETRGAV